EGKRLHHSHSAACRCCRSLFFDVCNNRLCCQQCRCHACSILQSASCNLCRIQDSGFHHVHILLFVCVESLSRLGLSYFVDDDSAFQSGVGNDVEQRSLQSFQHYVCTCLLVTFQRVSKFCHFL